MTEQEFAKLQRYANARSHEIVDQGNGRYELNCQTFHCWQCTKQLSGERSGLPIDLLLEALSDLRDGSD